MRERVRVGAKPGNDERRPLRHQARDESHVAEEAAELGHHHRRLALAGLRQRRALAGKEAGKRAWGDLPSGSRPL
jgi:hypothetical protein